MVEVQENKVPDVLEIKIIEKLSSADFKHIEPVLDKHIKEHAHAKLLLSMQAFSGWESASAFWKDLKMDSKYIGAFDRIALTGDARWEAWSAKLLNPVTSAEIKYFELEEIEHARRWLGVNSLQTPCCHPDYDPGSHRDRKR